MEKLLHCTKLHLTFFFFFSKAYAFLVKESSEKKK